MIRVYIVDDHEIIREGLKKVLRETDDLVVVGEARNGTEVLQNINDIDCDIILLDMSMPGRSGLDLITDLRKLKLHMHILVLSVLPEDKLALRTLRAGAAGYVCKDATLENLVTAIRKVYLRGRYISTTLAETLAFDFIPGERQPLLHESLSYRENEILYLLALGKKVNEIATDLELSVNTIFIYRKRILQKLKIEKSNDLTHYAIAHKIVE